MAKNSNGSRFGKFNFGVFLLAFGSFLVLAIGFFMVRLGYFREMKIQEMKGEKQIVVFKTHTGPYYKVDAVLTEIEQWAHAHNISCPKTFGLYLDNPEKTEEARLRAEVGCVLPPTIDVETVGAAISQDATEDSKKLQLGEIPAGAYLQILFDGSPAIGPQKIYPYARGYFRDHKWSEPTKTYEIYTIHSGKNMTTEYLFPIP